MHKLSLAAVALAAIALQGCIIYDDDRCDGDCEFDWDGDWDDDGGWCDEDGRDEDGDPCDDSVDEDPAPEFTLTLLPGQAELGETFLATLSAEGEFELQMISGVRFTSGLEVAYSEVRDTEMLILVDVPMDADLGPADLVVSRGAELPSVLVQAALEIGEPGSGYRSDDCE